MGYPFEVIPGVTDSLGTRLSPSSAEVLAKIEAAQARILDLPQIELMTEHIFHAGMYARTIRLPAGTVLVGALVTIPTLLIIHGDADVLVGDETAQVRGYGVFTGSAGRKQAFVCLGAVEMTMVFPTQAQTVEEAEREFTPDHENLMSHKSRSDTVVVTGE